MDGKKAEKLKEEIRRNPKKFLQPKIIKEKLTGKEKLDDDFFKAHGNTLNESQGGDRNNQYMEKTSEEMAVENSVTTVKSDKEIRKIMVTQYLEEKFTKHFVPQSHGGKVCKKCTAVNGFHGVLCWYCSSELYKNY